MITQLTTRVTATPTCFHRPSRANPLPGVRAVHQCDECATLISTDKDYCERHSHDDA